jgi:glucose-1-phosphate thymidylyltransferase
MKGIVLAGGNGTRLMPLTKVTNKHLLPVGQNPMIFYPICKLVDAGITDILIVTGTDHMGDIVGCLGSGKEFGCTFTYKVQDEAGGIAQALGLARGFCYGERMCVILGDNIFEDSLDEYVKEYNKQIRGGMVLLKEVENPERYGVAELIPIEDLDGVLGTAGSPNDPSKWKIVSIEEKPTEPNSNYAVTGIYFYDQRVFEIIDTLCPSNRGELEITDVNNAYIEWGELKYSIMKKRWTDAGTHQSLWFANQMISSENK